ncbi:septal ring factor EnvC (AmiA/AmiB activator) [Hasllibacter halocynthiae]|uniref:Septal ring factor EnvC (AmiA/AmiB activator) n=1 Tax=Hasllibacter halocynthiae TaxID=595589 RepID=A0A2T0X1Q4_9RHOB|nr:peptidoglycan DD-metalloendopeptidase family protein [Hasllibacter halocynthiae]PRY92847.1 septal ring factor EnvC (AmiA/AmiB activator) [Hasllibacter halocynthiae]
MRRPLLLATLLALLACGARAGPAEDAEAAAAALLEMAAGLEMAEEAGDRIAALTELVRAYERGLSAFREGLRESAARERALAVRADRDRARMERVLAALARVEATPEPLLLLHPEGPEATVRAGMLLGAAVPALRAEADALAAEAREARRLRRLREGAAAVLEEGLAGARAAREALATAVADRTGPPPRLLDDPARLAELAGAVETLGAFAGTLAPDPDAPAAAGPRPLPVAGTVLRAAGEPDAAGAIRPGVILATAPGALVEAPGPATVRYAGPLTGYENVIVLEPAANRLTVLAGLGRVYVRPGQVVAAGDALGLMGGRAGSPAAMVEDADRGAGEERSETLYIETRVDGAPADPAGWFAL